VTLTNAYLVRYEGGWSEAGDLASEVANGRVEARLDLGGVATNGQAVDIAHTVTDGSGAARVATIVDYEPVDADHPYVAFTPLDRVTALGPDGAMELRRVVGISVEPDDQGHPVWTLELDNTAIERDDSTARWLRRRLLGSLGGHTEASNPATPASRIESTVVQAKEWRVSKASTAAVLTSQAERLNTPAHLMLWEVTLSPPEGGEFVPYDDDVTVILVVSTVTVATVTVAAGDQSAHVGIPAELVTPADTIWADITDGPTDVALVGRARYI
jgi:hypothetical protein